MAKREPKLLRLRVAAHELGLHPITVRRWIKAGRLQAVPMGREVHIPRTEVQWLVGKVDGRLLVLSGRVSGHGQQDYLQILLASFGVTLTVLEPGEERTPEQELPDDLLSLIASFSGRLSGLRPHTQQALVACAKQVMAGQEE